MSKKLVITGGCGFIGSSFTRKMVRELSNFEIHNIDFLTYSGNKENLKAIEDYKNYFFHHLDIRDVDKVLEVCSGADYIVNFAAETHVDRSISGPEIFISTNVLGTTVLLEAATRFNSRMVHISTDEVYGSLEESDSPSNEFDMLKPSSPYSSSKASSDLICLSYFKTYGTKVSVTRCTNNYGPYQYPEKLIPVLIHKSLQNSPLPIYGNGRNIRDWIFVDDHSEAIENVMFNGRPGEIYNIGGSNQKRNLEICQIILDELADKTNSKIEFVSDRPGHDWRYAVNDSKIKNELGWKPKTDFNTGIRTTISWYLENRDWWEPLLNK
ncbi:MAG: dTDP-glucose 4,6-dehydratase [Halobacteriovoraceae bacterium]|nr:dTDP-glucose 4,6-dehydratase [Halobacteriovoraceae bacterium]